MAGEYVSYGSYMTEGGPGFSAQEIQTDLRGTAQQLDSEAANAIAMGRAAKQAGMRDQARNIGHAAAKTIAIRRQTSL